MAENPVISKKPLEFLWETRNPFLFCAHHRDMYPKGNSEMGPDDPLNGRNLGNDFVVKDGWRMYHGHKVPGFPAHPHRGFETVTIVLDGYIDHSDSLGAACRYGNGDVQWMTAGKGVQHSEMFPLINNDRPNTLELFQIWLNLPSKGKYSAPDYKMFWNEDIPVYINRDRDGRSTRVKVIAGSAGDKTAPEPPSQSWAYDRENKVNIWLIDMEADALWEISPETNVTRMLYFFRGRSVNVGGEGIISYSSIELKPDVPVIIRNGPENSGMLLMQGKPIDETVVQNGPFVMNSRKEIQETIEEYNRTEFGGWPWPDTEHVHERGSGRFARYQDGRIERKK